MSFMYGKLTSVSSSLYRVCSWVVGCGGCDCLLRLLGCCDCDWDGVVGCDSWLLWALWALHNVLSFETPETESMMDMDRTVFEVLEPKWLRICNI